MGNVQRAADPGEVRLSRRVGSVVCVDTCSLSNTEHGLYSYIHIFKPAAAAPPPATGATAGAEILTSLLKGTSAAKPPYMFK